MGKWLTRLWCKLGRCHACELYATDEGIGGRCIHCGHIYGWMTREELRASIKGMD